MADLRYGINPHQRASLAPIDGTNLPISLLSGGASYINLLDALNGWQLVREADAALGQPVAASFKHVSPAGVAMSGPIDDVVSATWALDAELSPLAAAYARAREADPKCSFGDMIAVSRPVDLPLARLIARVVSDGIVAPGFEPGTLEILTSKKKGSFLVIEADPDLELPTTEERDVFGVRLSQDIDRAPITLGLIDPEQSIPSSARADLVLGMITLRYTQSNSVAYLKDGMTLGIGAGQQSRVDCTKLAGSKVDTWWLRRHPSVRSLEFKPGVGRQERINWQIRYVEGDLLPAEHDRFRDALLAEPVAFSASEREEWLAALENVSFVSDGFIPFRDNIDVAAKHGVRYIAEPGGSTRNAEVEAACTEHRIVSVSTGLRLFHH